MDTQTFLSLDQRKFSAGFHLLKTKTKKHTTLNSKKSIGLDPYKLITELLFPS